MLSSTASSPSTRADDHDSAGTPARQAGLKGSWRRRTLGSCKTCSSSSRATRQKRNGSPALPTTWLTSSWTTCSSRRRTSLATAACRSSTRIPACRSARCRLTSRCFLLRTPASITRMRRLSRTPCSSHPNSSPAPRDLALPLPNRHLTLL